MNEALSQVQTEMGSEAIILSTRQVPLKSLIPWRKKRVETEITAALGDNQPRRQRQQAAVNQKPQVNSTTQATTETRIATDTFTGDDVTLEISPLAAREQLASQVKQQPKPEQNNRQASKTPRFNSQQLKPKSTSARPKQNLAPHLQPKRKTEAQADVVNKPVSSPKVNSEIASRIDTLQQMVERLNKQVHTGSQVNMPPELYPLFNLLFDAEVNSDRARELIQELNRTCSREQLQNPALCKSLLSGLIERRIQCSGPIAPAPGQRKVVALVGPTGVGKTTTIAKLASNFRLKQNMKMGLVTVDTYRIAAVEQLRTYAEIMDMPMKVVTNPLEMNRALDELSDLDLVLIDTAGRSPQDDLQIQEMKSLLSSNMVDEVHLVMSCVSSVKALVSSAQKFSVVPTKSIILTKLDEAPSLGSILSLQDEVGLPISYLTTGQAVPDDIEPAQAGRLARLILNQEALQNQI